MSKMYPHNWATAIVEILEDVLDKYDIFVPSPEDDERDWPENKARLYGSKYADILDPIEECLRYFRKSTEDLIFNAIIIVTDEIGPYLDPVSAEDMAKMVQDIREKVHEFIVRAKWVTATGGEVDEDGIYGNDDYGDELPPDIIEKGSVPCGLYCMDMLPDEDGGWQENSRQFVGTIDVQLSPIGVIAKNIVNAIADTTISIGVMKAPALTTTDMRKVFATECYGNGDWWEVGYKKGGSKPMYGVKLSAAYYAPDREPRA